MKYSKELCIEAFELILEKGLSNTALCKALDISPAIFYAWTNTNCKAYKPLFAEHITLARKKGKEYRRQEARSALRKFAMGYQYKESTTEYQDGKEVKKVVKVKHKAPNLGAVLAYLEENSKIFDV